MTMGEIGNLRRWDWFLWCSVVEAPVRSKCAGFCLGLPRQRLALMLSCPHGPPPLYLGRKKRLLPNKCDIFHPFRDTTPQRVWEKAGDSAQEVELRRRRSRVKNCSLHVIVCGWVASCLSHPFLTPCFFSPSPNPANGPSFPGIGSRWQREGNRGRGKAETGTHLKRLSQGTVSVWA